MTNGMCGDDFKRRYTTCRLVGYNEFVEQAINDLPAFTSSLRDDRVVCRIAAPDLSRQAINDLPTFTSSLRDDRVVCRIAAPDLSRQAMNDLPTFTSSLRDDGVVCRMAAVDFSPAFQGREFEIQQDPPSRSDE
jgi:hypothetical protein